MVGYKIEIFLYYYYLMLITLRINKLFKKIEFSKSLASLVETITMIDTVPVTNFPLKNCQLPVAFSFPSLILNFFSLQLHLK